jgi:CubicO group peptidase (beta-lactamase class C family)
MKLLGSLPLFHQPGERFTYGLNTDLLGYLIEVISGTSLDTFFRQRIFEPLGMKDTYFYLPVSKHARLVALHTEDKAQNKKLVKATGVQYLNGNFYPDYPKLKGTYFSGGGGLSSTAYDFGVFMQMLLNGGSYNARRILSPASVRMMTTNQIGSLSHGAGNKFGLGFEIVEPGNQTTPMSVGSYSWGGMFSSSYWLDPKEKMAAQLFINQYPMSHGEIHNEFKRLVYAAIK